MGYDLHITKKENWLDETGPFISEEEWRNLTSSESHIILTGIAENNGLSYENPLLGEWIGHSSGNKVWFDYKNGNITVKNPDEEIINKMLLIADKLGAKVQGDDGEFYPLEEKPVNRQKVMSLWNWFGNFIKGRFSKKLHKEPCPFKIGQRVKHCIFGECTVVSINRKGGGVLDTITVRNDKGKTMSFSIMASGLEELNKDQPL